MLLVSNIGANPGSMALEGERMCHFLLEGSILYFGGLKL